MRNITLAMLATVVMFASGLLAGLSFKYPVLTGSGIPLAIIGGIMFGVLAARADGVKLV